MIGVGARVPDARLRDADGRTIQLAETLGDGPAVLAFFKEECGASRVAVPKLPRLTQAYPSLRVLAVSQEDVESTRDYLDAKAPGLDALVDAPDFDASRAFGLDAVPAIFLIHAGRVVDVVVGWDRDGYNGLGDRAAALVGAAPLRLVAEDEGPAFRPG